LEIDIGKPSKNRKYNNDIIKIVNSFNKSGKMTIRRAKKKLTNDHNIKMIVGTTSKIWNDNYII
jgi:hypothetical protein